MRQLIKNSLILAVILTSLVSYSNESLFVRGCKSGNVTEITFKDVKEGSTLVMKDRKGTILYEEKIAISGTFTKSFDLSNLPDAKYYFEIDNVLQLKVIPVNIMKNNAELLTNEEYIITKPEMVVKDNYVFINQDLSNKKFVAIDVYYENNDLAFSESFKKTDSVNRVYDFSGSKKGIYLILVKTEGRIFKKSITI